MSWDNFSDKVSLWSSDLEKMGADYTGLYGTENLEDADSYTQAMRDRGGRSRDDAQALSDFLRENQDEAVDILGQDGYQLMLDSLDSGYAGAQELEEAAEAMRVYKGEEKYRSRQEQQAEAKSGFWGNLWGLLTAGAEQYANALSGANDTERTREIAQKQGDAWQGVRDAWDLSNEAAKATDWDGRDALIEEYRELQAEINAAERQLERGAPADAEELARDRARLEEIRAELEERDRLMGNGPRDYSLTDKAGSIVGGTAKRILGGIGNAAITTGDLLYKKAAEIEAAARLQRAYELGEDYDTEARLAETYGSEENQKRREAMYAAADSISDSAREDLERAKNGANMLGQAGIDIAENVLEMGFDAGVAAVTGAPGLASMFVRVYGDSAREAKEEGATLEEQALYGAAAGGIEVLTEKIADGVAGIYGRGAADDITESVIRRLSDSPTGQNLLRALTGAANEGGEEVLSDLLNPLAQKIYKDESVKELYSRLDPVDLVYDYLIGAAIGGFGSVTSTVSGQYAEANAENAQLKALYENMGESPTIRQEVMDRRLLREADRLAEEEREKKQEEARKQRTEEEEREAARKREEKKEAVQQRRVEEAAPDGEREAARKREERKEAVQQRRVEEAAPAGVSGERLEKSVESTHVPLGTLGTVDGMRYEDGKAVVVLKRPDGGTKSYDVDEVRKAVPQELGDLMYLAAGHGRDAHAVYMAYEPGQAIGEYSTGMDAAINLMAANGAKREYLDKSVLTRSLTEEQKDLAWEIGHARFTGAASPEAVKLRRGGVFFDGNARGIEGLQVRSEGDVRKAARKLWGKSYGDNVALATAVGKATGLKVVFYDSTQADGSLGRARGMYARDGSVYVDIHAGEDGSGAGDVIVARTLSHELTHFLEQNAPEEYRTLKAFVANELLRKGGGSFEELVARKTGQNPSVTAASGGDSSPFRGAGEQGQSRGAESGLSYEQAANEVVADACETMLTRSETVQRLAREHMSTAQRLWEHIKDVFGRMRESVSPKSREAVLLSDQFEEMSGIWDAALEKAAENGKSRKQSRTESKQAEAKTERAGKEKSAPASEAEMSRGVQYSKRGDGETVSIKQQIQAHAVELNKKPVVSSVRVSDMPTKDIQKQRRWVEARLRNTGYAVERKGLGRIEFTPSQINTGLNYLDEPGEIAAFATLPAVLKRGDIIDQHEEHKGRQRSSITIAAPVEINGVRGNVAVALTQTGKTHYHAHRIVMPDGSTFIFANELDAEPKPAGELPAKQALIAEPISSTSENSIAETAAESNTDFQYSIRDSTEGDTAEETEERVRSYSQLKADNAALKRQLERARREIRPTKEARVRRADAVKAAKKLLEGVNSAVTAQELADTIETMGNYVLRTDAAEWNEELLWKLARESAQDIIGTAWEPVENGMNEVQQKLRDYLEGKRLYLFEKYVPDLGQGSITTWKKHNPGIRVSTKTGLPVDTAYKELQELLGVGVLPEDVTHPADQLSLISELLQDSKKNETYNPFRAYMEEATESMTQDIIDAAMSDTLRAEGPTYADRQAEKLRRESVKAADKLARQEAKEKDRITRMRQEHKARIQEIRRNAQARVDEARAREKAEKWAKVKRLREYYREKEKAAAAKRRESAGVQKYRTRVEAAAKKLTDMLTHNTDKEHVPESLKEPLANFLMSLDFTSTRALNGGEVRKKDRYYTNRLEALLDVLRRQQAFQENEAEHDNVLGWHLDLPPGFTEQFRDHIEFMRAFESGDAKTDTQTPVNRMTAAQLSELAHFMETLQHSLSMVNQFLTESRYAGVKQAAMSTVKELKELGGVDARALEGAGKAIDQYFNWANTLPYYAFKRFGKAGAERFAAIAEGWGKMAFNVQQIKEYVEKTYTAEQVHEWERERHEIELESGETATMTTAQMMAFYCLAKRPQGLNHLSVGGMRVSNIAADGGKKAVAQTKAYNLTVGDMAKIGGMLTEEQLKVADALQRFMNTVCADWGNEVSMARFGYRAFTEQFYFPINVDRNGLEKDDPAARANDLYRMLNISATKGLTPNAHNAVVIESIFDVFANHTSDMAKYNALALPILDTFKWYGYQHRDYIEGTDAEGNNTKALKVDSVQKSIETAFGNQGQAYFRNFMKDLNGVKEGGRNEGLLKGVVGRYKAAAVAANLRVALQQPTSIARAALLIDPKYLAKGAAMKGGQAEALKYSGLAVWKKMGFFDTNIARGMREQIKHAETKADILRDKSMILAEKGDELTWGAIWNACKLETTAKTELTGEELLRETGRRFDEVILATQVMDSTISRSDMMRSASLGLAEYTSFMSEPTVTYNALLDLKTEFMQEKRRHGQAAAFKKTGGKLARTGAVYCVTAALTAAAAAIADAARDDDEYETTVQKWLEHFLENFAENLNPLKLLPGLADAFEILLGESDGKTMVAQVLGQVRNVLNLGAELWKELVLHEDAENKRTVYGKLYQIAQAVSSMTGLGIAPVMREFKALWNSTAAKAVPRWKLKTYDAGAKSEIRAAVKAGYLDEEKAVDYLVDAGEYDDTSTGRNAAYWTVRGWVEGDGYDRWQGVYDAALAGDRKAFDEAADFMDEHGYSPSAVRGQMNSQIKKWYAGGEIDDRQAARMLTEYGSALSDWDAGNTVREWSMEKETGFRYDEIQERFVSGNLSEAEAAKLLLDYGPDAKTRGETRNAAIREAQQKVREWKCEKETGVPFSKLQDAYIHGDIDRKQAEGALEKYGGSGKEAAEEKVTQWSLAKDTGVRYGGDEYSINSAYLHGEISMETAKAMMVSYGGKTEEQAAYYANQYDFTRQTGIEWSSGKGLQEAIKSGKYSDEALTEWAAKCDEDCHGSKSAAAEKVECARWLAEVPGCTTFTRDHLEKWNKNKARLERAGLGKEDFAKAVAAYSKEKSDYDQSTGESIEYSKCRKVMAYIDGLDITRDQKEALALSLYSDKYVRKCRRW